MVTRPPVRLPEQRGECRDSRAEPHGSACEAPGPAGHLPRAPQQTRRARFQAWAPSGVWGQKGEWGSASAIQKPVIYQDTPPHTHTHTEAETLKPL